MTHKVFRKLFTEEELNTIYSIVDSQTDYWEASRSVNGQTAKESYNTSRVAVAKTARPNKFPASILNKLHNAVQETKSGVYAFVEPWSIQKYKAIDRGHFHWHHDVLDFFLYHDSDRDKTHEQVYLKNIMPRRKMSVSVALNDRSDYNGGQFIIDVGDGKATPVDLDRGDTVIFDSYVYHGVEDVTGGQRSALIVWLVDGEELKEWKELALDAGMESENFGVNYFFEDPTGTE